MGDWRQRYPENVSVLQAERDACACQCCGQRRRVFNVHFFKENRVEDLCKACTIERAGGPEKVYVRSFIEGLRKTWEANTTPRDRAAKARPG